MFLIQIQPSGELIPAFREQTLNVKFKRVPLTRHTLF